MYWTDWGDTPKIERSDLDGGSRRSIVQGDLKWPNGLVIDEASRMLFWADAGLDKIETSNLMVKQFFWIISMNFFWFPSLVLRF